MRRLLLGCRNLKLCCYIFISLLLLQYFIYYTHKNKNYQTLLEKYNFKQKNYNLDKIINLDDKIDWENTSFIEYEANRVGPGEQGQPFELTDPKEIQDNDVLFKQEGFYVLVSDKISLQRALPDMRPESCKHKKYLRKLPKVSVIITFHNEIWSTLLRCIHSVFNRSPSELLHEIILINDRSTFSELYDPLKRYINGEFDNKIKIYDNRYREGLIKSRMIGAKLAEAEVIIFLDSHMEVTNTWLPPLLEPLVYNPTYAVVPIVEGMNHATFAYEFVGHGYKGIFDWNFRYQWLPFDSERTDPGENFKLACMTGGAYAIRKEHFFYLEGYDEELQIWNGENYELTLKLWLCSGGMLSVPCSRIIHLSKLHSAYRKVGDGSDFIGRNLKRVAEVWLDEYKQYFYRNEPNRYYTIDAGDLTKQFDIKERLKCKPFQYYLDVIAPEMLIYYPIIPQQFAAYSIQHMESERCITINFQKAPNTIFLDECSLDLKIPNLASDFILTLERSIKYNDTNDQCLNSHDLSFSNCHHLGHGQYWKFQLDTRQIYQPYTKKCLSGSLLNNEIKLEKCDIDSLDQKWKWGYENVTALNNWDTTGIKSDY